MGQHILSLVSDGLDQVEVRRLRGRTARLLAELGYEADFSDEGGLIVEFPDIMPLALIYNIFHQAVNGITDDEEFNFDGDYKIELFDPT